MVMLLSASAYLSNGTITLGFFHLCGAFSLSPKLTTKLPNFKPSFMLLLFFPLRKSPFIPKISVTTKTQLCLLRYLSITLDLA